MWNPLKGLRRERSRNVDEHFVPGRATNLRDAIRAGERDAVHQLIRYEWAPRCPADRPARSLLDLATGSGYGAHDLAVRLPSTKVAGIDYDADAIEQARARYAMPNLEYRTGDATRWTDTIGPETFDAIVSFDMVEHVVYREIMMEGLVRHLAPGGTLLLSTPGGELDAAPPPRWPPPSNRVLPREFLRLRPPVLRGHRAARRRGVSTPRCLRPSRRRTSHLSSEDEPGRVPRADRRRDPLPVTSGRPTRSARG